MDNEHWYDIDTRKENSIKRLLAISIGEFRSDTLNTLPSAAVDRVRFSANSEFTFFAGASRENLLKAEISPDARKSGNPHKIRWSEVDNEVSRKVREG